MSNLSEIPQQTELQVPVQGFVNASDAAMSGENSGTAHVPIQFSEQPEPFFLHRHAQKSDQVDDAILEGDWDIAASFVRTISADGTRSTTTVFTSERTDRL